MPIQMFHQNTGRPYGCMYAAHLPRPPPQLLLEAGAHPEMTDNFGSSALLEACTYGHDAIIDILVQHGARLGSDGVEDASLLCTCVYEGNMPKLRRLLRAGLPVNAFDYDRRTAAHISAAEGNLTAVRASGRLEQRSGKHMCGNESIETTFCSSIMACVFVMCEHGFMTRSTYRHGLHSCVCWLRRVVPTWGSWTVGATQHWMRLSALAPTTSSLTWSCA